jgi:hypothetical protein
VTDNPDPIRAALALVYDCEPDEIGLYACICERNSGDGPIASSTYSAVPHWLLLGLVDELREHVERLRRSQVADAIRNGGSG